LAQIARKFGISPLVALRVSRLPWLIGQVDVQVHPRLQRQDQQSCFTVIMHQNKYFDNFSEIREFTPFAS